MVPIFTVYFNGGHVGLVAVGLVVAGDAVILPGLLPGDVSQLEFSVGFEGKVGVRRRRVRLD